MTRSHGVMVSTQDSESCNPSSNLGGTFFSAFISFASVNNSLTIATHMRFGVTCVSVFPNTMQTRNPAISTSSLSI